MADLKDLNVPLGKLKSDLNMTETKLNDLKRTYSEMKVKIKTLEDEKTIFDSKLSDLEKTNQEIKTELVNFKSTATEKQQTLENQIFSHKRDLELAKSDFEKLRNQLSQKEEKINTLESQKEELSNLLRNK